MIHVDDTQSRVSLALTSDKHFSRRWLVGIITNDIYVEIGLLAYYGVNGLCRSTNCVVTR